MRLVVDEPETFAWEGENLDIIQAALQSDLALQAGTTRQDSFDAMSLNGRRRGDEPGVELVFGQFGPPIRFAGFQEGEKVLPRWAGGDSVGGHLKKME